jgi:four helix bundle protein
MATIQKFEDLSIWQKARTISKKVYRLTFAQPLSGDFRLKDQLRGSSGSIMDNIAEGFDRGSRLEFVNSLSIAKGESGELKSQLYGCLDVDYISKEIFEELYNEVDEVSQMIAGFMEYLNTSTIKGKKFKNRIDGKS